MGWKDHRCPFCEGELKPGPHHLDKVGPALYAYIPCGCEVQFTVHGYPRKPKKQ